MSDAWLGVIGALGGVMIADLLAHIRASTAFRREQMAEERKLVRDRLEELYQHLEDFKRLYSNAATRTQLRMAGKAVEAEPQAQLPLARIRMLVGLYLPESMQEMNSLETTCGRFSDVLADTLFSPPTGIDKSADLPMRLHRAYEGVETSCNALLTSVVRHSSDLRLTNRR